MEYVILGLLMAGPMTSYELQTFIRDHLSTICSSSAGGIQAALKRLEADGRITIAQSEGPRRRRMLAITDKGRAAFGAWVSEPMESKRSGNMGLAKLYFLDYAPRETQVDIIKRHVAQLEQTYCALQLIASDTENIREQDVASGRISPWETLSYGIAAADFEIRWYQGLLERLRSN